MTIKDLQALDVYKCSKQDINKAFRAIRAYEQKLIKKGHASANNSKGTELYTECWKLRVRIARAHIGMSADGFMFQNKNERPMRLPNSESVL